MINNGKLSHSCEATLIIEKDGKRYELRNAIISGGENFLNVYSNERIKEVVNEHRCCEGGKND